MRSELTPKWEQYRLRTGNYSSTKADGMNGAFVIPYRRLIRLHVIVSDQLGWDHVSVSLNKNRPPTWEEMCFIKDIFFDEEETVAQLHPPKSKYINRHPNVLHMWRPQHQEIFMPPLFMV